MAKKDIEEVVPLRDYVERVFREKELAASAEREDLEHRLGELNQLRAQYVLDRNQFLTREIFAQEAKAVTERAEALAANVISRTEALNTRMDGMLTKDIFEVQHQRLAVEVEDLKKSRSIIVGVGLVLIPLAGVIGGVIVKIFGG